MKKSHFLVRKASFFTAVLSLVLVFPSFAGAQFDGGWGDTYTVTPLQDLGNPIEISREFVPTVTVGQNDAGWGDTQTVTNTTNQGWGDTPTVSNQGYGDTQTVLNNGKTTNDAGWGDTQTVVNTTNQGWGNDQIGSSVSGWGSERINVSSSLDSYYLSSPYSTGYSVGSSLGGFGLGGYGFGGTSYGYTGYGYGTPYTYFSASYTSPSVVTTPVVTVPSTPIMCTMDYKVCPDGSPMPRDSNCTWRADQCPAVRSVVTYPSYTYTTSNTSYTPPIISGTTYNYNNSYQTCWDGSVIPSTSMCSSQYKTCPNGAIVPVGQVCYITTPSITLPTRVAFNNVVTSLATGVTNKEGRCNGIGLIANNASSFAWFEYGETSNLGRSTAQAAIGSSHTAPFSNLLTNLKPSTTYYCRAVMQNQYGLVKGEIVSFTTKASATTYIAPAIKTKTVTSSKTTTKAVTTKKENEVVCADGTTVTVKSGSTASLLKEGNKLATLEIVKVSGKISSDEVVKYKVAYKNNTDSRLSGVVVKVKLAEEIKLFESNQGLYDENTRTITLNQDTLDPYAEGAILFSGIVTKTAPLGKTIVNNAYLSYTVPGTTMQDEVTSYVIGSVVPNENGGADTGAKKVIGAGDGKGFLPGSLIEWLALVAILFIIFILGRSIHASYKEGGDGHH